MSKRVLVVLSLLLFVGIPAMAQEHYTEGPVWRISFYKIKANQQDAYFASLRQKAKPYLDQMKQQGIIVDYKTYLNETNSGHGDWDLALAVEYKNFASLDGLTAKMEAARDKFFGSKDSAQQVGQQRTEMREEVGSILVREVMFK
jgi:competence protein ComGC